jgi:CHAT domain-containing protein
MNSAFALFNGDLELSQIVSKRLSAGQFAFLSVCHAAAGLRSLPGEAMHLAGGLQFAGFPSVIATMWSINDEDAPIVADYTYQYLFRNGLHCCDPSEAAMALNHAVLRLREDTNVTLDRWAPFIHFGV